MAGDQEAAGVKWNCDPQGAATLSYAPASSSSSPASLSESAPPLSLWSLTMTAGLAGDDDESPVTLCMPPSESVSPVAEATPSGSPNYRLRVMLARGGMGEVWDAEQTSLGRTVAVKRIRRDRWHRADREAAALEFRKEAITSAMLEHPNIVPVHDFGVSSDGSPLLAMKLVKGRAWDELLDEEAQSMPREDFLSRHVGILVSVAQAVAFAHSRGIVHRDLKPAQVMVGEFGEVLLMDWGLALFIGDEIEGNTQTSEYALPLPNRTTASSPSGTPALMAPEQTLTSAAEVGPWTDVFLLGGTLYYILTNSYPHEAKTAEAAMALAARGVVVDPRVRAPESLIPEDLAELCMRSLARDPGERPAGALDFLRGLQDHLGGAGKRRESADITERLDIGKVTSGADYEDYSERLADLARAETLWPANPRIAPLRDTVLEAFASVAAEAGDLKLARVQARRIFSTPPRERLLARIESEESRLRMQSRTRRAAIWAVISLLLVVIGGGVIFNKRVTMERNAAQAAEKKATAARGEAESMVNYMMNDLAQQLEPIGKLNLMEGVSDQVIKYGERSNRDEASIHGILGQVQAYCLRASATFDRGDPQSALEEFDRAEQLARLAIHKWPQDKEARLSLLGVLDQGSGVRVQSGDLEGARATIQRQLDEVTKLVDSAPADVDYVRLMGKSLEHLARVQQAMGNWDEAHVYFGRAGKLFDDALAQFPDDVGLSRSAKGCYQQLGSLESDRNEPELANAAFAKARAIAASAYQSNPDNTQEIESLALLDNLEANHLRSIEQFDRAMKLDEAYVAAMRKLVEIEPESMRWRYQLAVGESNIGFNQMQLGNFDAALEAFRLYVSTMEDLCVDHPGNQSWQMELADGIQNMAATYHKMGRMDEAIEAAKLALSARERCLSESPGQPRLLSSVLSSAFRLADWMWESGNTTDDKVIYEWCLKHIDAAGEAGREDWAQSARAELLYRLERLDESRAIAQKLLQSGYRNEPFDALCVRLGIPLPPAP